MQTIRRIIFCSALQVLLISSGLVVPLRSEGRERSGELRFTIDITVIGEPKELSLWLPLPRSDSVQTVGAHLVTGDFTREGTYSEPEYGNKMVYAQWIRPRGKVHASLEFGVKRRNVSTGILPGTSGGGLPEEVSPFLRSTRLCPTGGRVEAIAKEVTRGKLSDVERARALYDYLIDSMEREPTIEGCGTGDVLSLLEERKGKCVDFHSVYVSLGRSVGIPAREVFGIRLPPGKEGTVTKAYHCWAEVYLPGIGWMPVDAADVRKIALERKVTRIEEVKDVREFYFGSLDENRVAFGTGRDVQPNPPQKAGKLNYFMYPYAEVDGRPLDSLGHGAMAYEVTFRER